MPIVPYSDRMDRPTPPEPDGGADERRRPGAERRPPRERVLDAALAVLGQQGLRALTHARVDEAAGLPRGSASNYFRTRRALLDGMVEHLARREQADFAGTAPVRRRMRSRPSSGCSR